MQPRFPAPRAFDSLAVAPRPGSERGGLRLVLDHLRRRSTLRRRQALPESRLGYLFDSLAGWQRQATWLRLVDASRDLRAVAERQPHLFERWRAPHISREFDLATRARILEAHYRFVEREFPARLRERLLKGHDLRLATLPLGQGQMAYLHARAPEDERSGELGLYLLNGQKEVVASCAITFGGAEGLLIGGVRGAWAYLGRAATAHFIRASGGARPRDLLLAVVRALAAHYGILRLRGVADAARPVERRGKLMAIANDRFWRRHGGRPGVAGCYEIPARHETSPTARGDAFGRDACQVALRAFARQPQKS